MGQILGTLCRRKGIEIREAECCPDHIHMLVNNLLTRLMASIDATMEIRKLFNSKHAHIFVAAFKAFTESGRNDAEFGRFLKWFVSGGSETEIDGKVWDILGLVEI